jgi:hypothetical protein
MIAGLDQSISDQETCWQAVPVGRFAGIAAFSLVATIVPPMMSSV